MDDGLKKWEEDFDALLAEYVKDDKQIISILDGEDPIGVVIRGHLFVESKLIRFIETKLPEPNAVDLARPNFFFKLDLAVALQVISKEEKRGFLALNNLRNRMAHKADLKLISADEEKIYNALSARQRATADQHSIRYAGREFAVLRASVLALCAASMGSLFLDRAREMINSARRNRRAWQSDAK
jgi:hypothetical protein